MFVKLSGQQFTDGQGNRYQIVKLVSAFPEKRSNIS